MMRFDINACFGHWPYWDLYHKSPDDLIALMDSNGIALAACMSLRGLIVDWRRGNAETFAAVARYPRRLLPVVTVSPYPDGDGGELRRLCDAGARAVRLSPLFHSYRLDDEFVDDVCSVAAEVGIPVMIATRPMMNWRFAAIPIDSLCAVMERYPKTSFILSGPNYLIEFQALVRLMGRCKNVSFDISCLQGFGSVASLVRQVGVDRVLFGTGALLHYPACNVAKLDNAEITAEECETIAWGNAMSLLGGPDD